MLSIVLSSFLVSGIILRQGGTGLVCGHSKVVVMRFELGSL